MSGQILVTDHWSLPVRPLSNQRLDRKVPSWEFLSGWSGHLLSESPSFSDLNIWIFYHDLKGYRLDRALKSHDDQHDDKGEYRLDILIMGYS